MKNISLKISTKMEELPVIREKLNELQILNKKKLKIFPLCVNWQRNAIYILVQMNLFKTITHVRNNWNKWIEHLD